MEVTNTAPITAPLTMDAYRDAYFRKAVMQRIAAGKLAGKTAAQVVAEISAEQRALATAITTPAFVDVASKALMDAQMKLSPDARYQSTSDDTHEAMYQILHRRAPEALGYAQHVLQPSFYEPLVNATPAQLAAPVTPTIDAVKMKDTLDDLLHVGADGAPQVIAHIDATAKGMMIEHDALAIAFTADGVLHTPLMEALAKELPHAPREQIHALTLDWLGQRYAAAKLSADLAGKDGAAYREAVRQSTEWHRKPYAAAPVTTVHAEGLHHYTSARQAEHHKSKLERAEDISYTINHALSCGTTDVILQPAIAAAFGMNVGCNPADHHHDHHGHEHHHHEHGAKPKMTLKMFAAEAGHYFKGEIIGDFLAVPLTIAVQRLFPGFMNAIRHMLEPVAGWAFRRGAKHSTRNWARNEGIDINSAEAKAHEEEVYEREISHLPQAAVWNMFAYPIGAVAQKVTGHNKSYPEIFKSKLVGALISNGLLIGGRMVAPGAAQKWDQATSEHIFMPVSKAVGKVLGTEKPEKKPTRWQEQVSKDDASPELAQTQSR